MNNEERRRELEAKKAKLEEFKKRKLERVSSASNENSKTVAAIASVVNIEDIERIFSEIELKKENDKKFEKIFIKNDDMKKKYLQKLSINPTNVIVIPSKEIIKYSKETQTVFDVYNSPKSAKPLNKSLLPLECYEGPFIYDTFQWEDEFINNSSLNQSYDVHTNDVSDFQDYEEELEDEGGECSSFNKDDRTMTGFNNEEKIKGIIESKEFLEFFTKKSNIIERALNQEDIFSDYGFNFEEEIAKNENDGEALKICREFNDEKYKNRIVTSLDWSLHFPELLLTSYESNLHESNEGTALIWNLKFEKSTPEYTFNCSSWITSCCFNNFHPNIIIGGTYSGQIVMWDTRSNKHTPVQRSTLAITSHTNPVYCVKVIGTSSSNNLLTISNDGRLCAWALENMNSPIETVDIHVKQSNYVPVTCMDFQPVNDLNSFIIGTEDASIYTVPRQNNSFVNETFDGHYGPITSISCNQAVDPIDYSNVFLTSSFDWSIKLWNIKEPSTPIYSFENSNDYVYDVSWSPIHPTLFASVDGEGKLDLWNLTKDSEVPTTSICLNGTALNKLKWTKCGSKIAIGDDLGRVSIVEVNESIWRPKSDDSKKFINVLNELKQNYSDLQEIHGINRSSNY